MTNTANRTINVSDGYELAATVFHPRVMPSNEEAINNLPKDAFAQKVVVINSATAVPREFYAPFATYLTQHGYTVLTYDYRGIGGSRPSSLRGFKASMSDWGLLDMNGVVDWVHSTLSPDRLFIIGHSVGGQQAGLISRSERVDGMVTLSAQSGYWRFQGGVEKYKNLLQVNLLLPALSHAMGYFPWSKFASGEDLPKGVALQWASWCRNPQYLLGDNTLPLDRFSEFEAPVLAYSFEDDTWGTAESVHSMMSAYPNVTYQHIVPVDHGLTRVGHVGFFREQSAVLWDDMLQWISALP